MNKSLSVSVLALAMVMAGPALAACGSGADGAAMCGKPAKTQAKMSKSAPNATPAPSSKGMAGGCACCKDMAMMKDMDGSKDMPKDMPKEMPGMAK